MEKFDCFKGVQNTANACFPTFGLNSEIYSINRGIQSKCGKKNCVFGHFSRSVRKVSKKHIWLNRLQILSVSLVETEILRAMLS